MIFAGSVHHMVKYRGANQIFPVAHLAATATGWELIERSIKSHFHGGSPPVRIATTAAGAIPYYAELPAVDMHGLNDRFIARHGEPSGSIPGHWRITSHRYLVENGVNLVVGHPLVQKQTEKKLPAELKSGIRGFRVFAVETDLTPDPVPVIELPIDENYKVSILYLIPHPQIDAAIRNAALTVRYLSVSGD